MNTHLVKCKKNYPDAKLFECDFNVNHKIPEPELQVCRKLTYEISKYSTVSINQIIKKNHFQYHHDNCPDRNKMEMKMYQEEDQDLNMFPIQNICVPTEDTWDDVSYQSQFFLIMPNE